MGDAKPILEVKGVNGQIKIYDDHIAITHKGAIGFLTQGYKGEKTILLRQISSVQFKDAGLATNGYIQFAFMGGHETKGGLFNATKDENTVMFNRGQRKDFANVRDEVMARIGTASDPAHPGAVTSIADELAKLAALRDQGVLSAEEFEAEKRRVLSRT